MTARACAMIQAKQKGVATYVGDRDRGGWHLDRESRGTQEAP
jgi:hypothetical protein